MNRYLGQILRFVGLLIELLGILALAFRTGADETGRPLPGSFPPRLVWGVIIAGFVIWIVGTILNFWTRTARPDSLAKPHSLDLHL